WPLVQLGPKLCNRFVHRAEREEGVFAQGSQYPSLDYLHAHFDFGLVAGPAWTRRHNGDTVVLRHLFTGEVHAGLVPAGPRDTGFLIVGDDDLGNAAEKLEGANVRTAPVAKSLCPGCFGERVVAGPEHGDE